MLRTLLIGLLLVAACKDDRPESASQLVPVGPEGVFAPAAPPPSAGEEVAAKPEPPPIPPLPQGWWTADPACPAGAELRGAAPPRGSAIWCEQPGGVRQGGYTSWHPLSDDAEPRLHERGRYADGDRVGTWTSYWPAGGVKSEVEYRMGDLHGRARSYFEGGGVRREGHYSTGTAHGQFTGYTRAGKVIETVTIWDGDGTMIEWYPDGRRQHVYAMVAGRPHGLWTTYDPDGNKIAAITYAYGQRHGDATTWDAGRRVTSRGRYAHDMKDGRWVHYTRNGDQEITVYRRGVVVEGQP